MTDQITVPRATWDAMREALQIADNIALVGAAYTPKSIEAGLRKISAALTAANAVDEPVGINGLTEAETSASMSVMGLSKPQAQGKAIHQVYMGDGWKDKPASEMWMYTPEKGWESKYVRTVYAHPQATEPAWRPIETAPASSQSYKGEFNEPPTAHTI